MIVLKPWQAFALAALFILTAAVLLPGCGKRGEDISGFWQWRDRVAY